MSSGPISDNGHAPIPAVSTAPLERRESTHPGPAACRAQMLLMPHSFVTITIEPPHCGRWTKLMSRAGEGRWGRMTTYEILITDVTCYSNLYCVAGWDLRAGRMIRPEPPDANMAYEPSKFWAGQGPGRSFSVGNVVRIAANPPPAQFPFPHATEDRIVVAGPTVQVLGALDSPRTVAAVAAGVSRTLGAAFDNALVRPPSGKAYVPAGHNGRSLGAIEITPAQLRFFEDAYPGKKTKLRARLVVDGNWYNLSVTADAARTRWLQNGLAALQGDVQASGRLHVRVGLSRPWGGRPNECVAQINGVYLL